MSIKATLTKTDLSMIVVSFVIGIGIFRTPAIVAQKAGSPELFYAAWILGGLISICGALTFAEIGSRFPVAGGFYKIFSACYHPVFAFMMNWSLVIINSFSAVGVALVGAEYITPVIFPPEMHSQIYVQLIALLMILILFALNYAGIKTGARAQNILSGIKIIMILFFSSAILFSHPAATPVQDAITSSGSFMTILGISLISVFFTYGGYQNTMNLGADVRDPQRTIPVSIFRKRMKNTIYTGFRLKLYPWIPLVFMAMLLTVTYNVFISDVNAAITGLCIFAAGFPLYKLLKRINKSAPNT